MCRITPQTRNLRGQAYCVQKPSYERSSMQIKQKRILPMSLRHCN